MVANPNKFQVIFPGDKNGNLALYINNNCIASSDCVKLLGVIIDKDLSFTPYITDICKKANTKTKALLRIRNYLNIKQTILLCNSFILSYFNYCPLVWMFCNKTTNNIIQKTQIRALRCLLNNFTLESKMVLNLTRQRTIHETNLSKLAMEMYKILNKISPLMLSNIFEFKNNNYNLRKSNLLAMPKIIDPNSWTFRGILLWNNLNDNIKTSTSLLNFKNNLKDIELYCKCKICHH